MVLHIHCVKCVCHRLWKYLYFVSYICVYSTADEATVGIDAIALPPPQWDRMEAYMTIIAEATHIMVLSLEALVEKDSRKTATQEQWAYAESSSNSDITKASHALKRKCDCHALALPFIAEGSSKRSHKVSQNPSPIRLVVTTMELFLLRNTRVQEAPFCACLPRIR